MLMRRLRILLLAATAVFLTGMALAQGEPTLQEIYGAAQSGQLDKAKQMTRQVLRDHPNSAKAHFVMAELEAREGNTAQARQELATAESLAPGLPFARPEAVQALRTRVATSAGARSAESGLRSPAQAATTPAARETAPAPSFPWGMVLLGAVAVAVIATVLRSRSAARTAASNRYSSAGAGAAVPAAAWGSRPDPYQQPGYPQQGPQGYGQPGYGPQPARSGMGGNIMGGLATGLAVGAGALAAQEIGRRMMGDHNNQQGLGSVADGHGSAADSSLARDAGLGSVGQPGAHELPQDFGVNDTASWDDAGGSFDVGGGGDGGWDS